MFHWNISDFTDSQGFSLYSDITNLTNYNMLMMIIKTIFVLHFFCQHKRLFMPAE